MLVVHHLNDSRSQRVLWLLEELGLPYDIKHYQRDAVTRLAPPELKAVHPLGKSPVLTDGDRTVIESGAIVDYVIRHHGRGQLAASHVVAGFRDLPAMAALRRGLGHAAVPAEALCVAPGRGRCAVVAAHRKRDRQPPGLRRAVSARPALAGGRCAQRRRHHDELRRRSGRQPRPTVRAIRTWMPGSSASSSGRPTAGRCERGGPYAFAS